MYNWKIINNHNNLPEGGGGAMHSRFRVTNSSDRLGLDVGVPQVRGIIKAFWKLTMRMTYMIRMASNAAMVTVKSSQVYRVPPVSQGNQGERSQHEKKGQEELRSGDRHSPWQWYPWICCSIPHHFRLYLEPKLHCRKLRPSHEENDREGADGTWIPVEPHQVLATGKLAVIITIPSLQWQQT